MDEMGTAKDIIIMLVMIAAVIGITAFMNRLKIGERMDKSIEAVKVGKKSSEDIQTMKYTLFGGAVIAVGVVLLIVLKKADVITDTFFPYCKI